MYNIFNRDANGFVIERKRGAEGMPKILKTSKK